MDRIRTIRARRALLADGWAGPVDIRLDANGDIETIAAAAGEASGEQAGVLLPALPNVHSHAHQRALAGLAEYRGDGDDSFWSWREAMYQVLARIGPEDLEAIAAQLYVEMLKAGYACVGEFQYLHHAVDGRPYAERAEMSLRCLAAAREVGIGITLLPVLYRHGGFGGRPPGAAQRRFVNDATGFQDIVARLEEATRGDRLARVGIAPHSLRAVDPALLDEVLAAGGGDGPVHIHVAEQTREVEECLAWSGRRPVDWLFEHCAVDRRWCLVHATHVDEHEAGLLAASGCVVGLCPTTEANLGDGLFDAARHLAAGGAWAIGSDSQVSVDPVEELRWLEYGARLLGRARNRLANTDGAHSGRILLDGALAGGARALDQPCGAIAPGRRADWIVLDEHHPRLYRRADDSLLDSWIFSGNERLVRDVYVGGRKLVERGRHPAEEAIANRFRQTLDRLATT